MRSVRTVVAAKNAEVREMRDQLERKEREVAKLQREVKEYDEERRNKRSAVKAEEQSNLERFVRMMCSIRLSENEHLHNCARSE